MVDSVAGAASGALSRSQTAGVSMGIAALKSSQQAQQAIVEQLQKTADQGRAATNQLAAKAVNQASANLPRGSLINILV